MFESLDFVYVPTGDVDASVTGYVEQLGASLEWKVRAMGTVVACLRMSADGPRVLLAGHLAGDVPVLIYRVASYRDAVDSLRAAGVDLREVEIPSGPCATFVAEGGQHYGVYELTRPGAANSFLGRVDD